MKKVFSTTVILAVFLLAFTACQPAVTPAPTATPAQPSSTALPSPSMQVTAQELCVAYRTDKSAADAKYRGKVIEVSGEVISVNKDTSGNSVVILSGGQAVAQGVQCVFNKSYETALSKVVKGQVIIAQGRCDGYDVNVLLKDCAFIGIISLPAPKL